MLWSDNMTKVCYDWLDYECLDAGNGEKLERWGKVILRRPDPQAIWQNKLENPLWNNPDGFYHRSSKGGGNWEVRKKLPESWTIKYKNLTFKVSPTNFKHTGLFPEQASNWDYMMDKIKASNRQLEF
jgi:23S rRNA (cytosine1962-C5)-methyltransferase